MSELHVDLWGVIVFMIDMNKYVGVEVVSKNMLSRVDIIELRVVLGQVVAVIIIKQGHALIMSDVKIDPVSLEHIQSVFIVETVLLPHLHPQVVVQDPQAVAQGPRAVAQAHQAVVQVHLEVVEEDVL